MLRVRRRIAYRRESKIVARPLLFHVRNADAAESFPSDGIDSNGARLACFSLPKIANAGDGPLLAI